MHRIVWKHRQSFQVASLSIDTCVTFDRHGVSGHRNHISLYYALACLAMEDRERSVFCLTSVNLLRKYSGVVDVPMTFLVCPTVYLAGLAQWFQLQRAMMAHWSQVVIEESAHFCKKKREDVNPILLVHMVPPPVHAVLALHTNQHVGANEQAGWAGQEGLLAGTQCNDLAFKAMPSVFEVMTRLC